MRSRKSRHPHRYSVTLIESQRIPEELQSQEGYREWKETYRRIVPVEAMNRKEAIEKAYKEFVSPVEAEKKYKGVACPYCRAPLRGNELTCPRCGAPESSFARTGEYEDTTETKNWMVKGRARREHLR